MQGNTTCKIRFFGFLGIEKRYGRRFRYTHEQNQQDWGAGSEGQAVESNASVGCGANTEHREKGEGGEERDRGRIQLDKWSQKSVFQNLGKI